MQIKRLGRNCKNAVYNNKILFAFILIAHQLAESYNMLTEEEYLVFFQSEQPQDTTTADLAVRMLIEIVFATLGVVVSLFAGYVGLIFAANSKNNNTIRQIETGVFASSLQFVHFIATNKIYAGFLIALDLTFIGIFRAIIQEISSHQLVELSKLLQAFNNDDSLSFASTVEKSGVDFDELSYWVNLSMVTLLAKFLVNCLFSLVKYVLMNGYIRQQILGLKGGVDRRDIVLGLKRALIVSFKNMSGREYFWGYLKINLTLFWMHFFGKFFEPYFYIIMAFFYVCLRENQAKKNRTARPARKTKSKKMREQQEEEKELHEISGGDEELHEISGGEEELHEISGGEEDEDSQYNDEEDPESREELKEDEQKTKQEIQKLVFVVKYQTGQKPKEIEMEQIQEKIKKKYKKYREYKQYLKEKKQQYETDPKKPIRFVYKSRENRIVLRKKKIILDYSSY